MPKVSEAHQEERRRSLLEAAARSVARRGFSETSVKEICEEAGVSAGSVYLHFNGKDEIVEEIARDVLGAHALGYDVLDGEADPVAGIAALVRGLGAGAEGAPPMPFQLRVHAWAAALTHPTVMEAFRSGFEQMQRSLVAAIRRGQADGQVDPAVEPEAAAAVILGTLQGLVLQLTTGTGVNASAYAESCATMIERLLRPRATSPLRRLFAS